MLPVSLRVRWLTVLLAAQSWPFLYAIKLGQVGPILFLLFALGWRWVDSRPIGLGVTAALGRGDQAPARPHPRVGAPHRRWLAVAAGALTLLALAVAATVLAGPQAWTDFALLVGRVADPITTPHNVTPGAIAYALGASRELSSTIQWLSMALAIGAVVFAAFRLPAAPSYLVAVIASQLLSPILWDHYAMLLLLPVAWLLERGQWWAIGAALVTSVLFVGVIPPWVYPVAFWAMLVAVVGVGLRRNDRALAAGAAAGDPVRLTA